MLAIFLRSSFAQVNFHRPSSLRVASAFSPALIIVTFGLSSQPFRGVKTVECPSLYTSIPFIYFFSPALPSSGLKVHFYISPVSTPDFLSSTTDPRSPQNSLLNSTIYPDQSSLFLSKLAFQYLFSITLSIRPPFAFLTISFSFAAPLSPPIISFLTIFYDFLFTFSTLKFSLHFYYNSALSFFPTPPILTFPQRSSDLDLALIFSAKANSCFIDPFGSFGVSSFVETLIYQYNQRTHSDCGLTKPSFSQAWG